MKCLIWFILLICGLSFPVFSQGVGSTAPDFTLNSLSHGQISLSQFGGKVVYLYFLGHDCPPCLQPTGGPATEYSIWQVYQNYDFQAIGIDCWDGTVTQLLDFQFETGITYPLCLNGSATCADYFAPASYSVVVNQAGKIAYVGIGVELPQITHTIDSLLGITSINEDAAKVKNFKLYQNYPNPFNPSTTIEFILPQKAFVELNIYNLLGEEITSLVSRELSADSYRIAWNATDFPAGVYFYRLFVANSKAEKSQFSQTRKLILLK